MSDTSLDEEPPKESPAEVSNATPDQSEPADLTSTYHTGNFISTNQDVKVPEPAAPQTWDDFAADQEKQASEPKTWEDFTKQREHVETMRNAVGWSPPGMIANIATGDELSVTQRFVNSVSPVGHIIKAFGEQAGGYEYENEVESDWFKNHLAAADYKSYKTADVDISNGLYDGFIAPAAHNIANGVNYLMANAEMPLVTAGLATWHAPGAAISGVLGEGGAADQFGDEIGHPGFGPAARMGFEALPALGIAFPEANLPIGAIREYRQAKSFVDDVVTRPAAEGIIGPGATDETYFGTAPKPEGLRTAMDEASASLGEDIGTEKVLSVAERAETEARAAAPEAFTVRDEAQGRIDTFKDITRSIEESAAEDTEGAQGRTVAFEAWKDDNSPFLEKINDLQSQIDNIQSSKSGKFGKLAALQEKKTALEAEDAAWRGQQQMPSDQDLVNTITQRIQKEGQRIVDVADDLTKARNDAFSKLRAAEEGATTPSAEPTPAVEGETAPVSKVPSEDWVFNDTKGEWEAPSVENKGTHINHDVSGLRRKIASQWVNAGHDAEEAHALADVTSAMYRNLANTFKGELGGASELFDKYGYKVVEDFQKKGVKAVSKGRWLQARDGAKAIIKRFEKADASTLIHESAHHWLDTILKLGEDVRAPEALRKDIETIKGFLGTKEGQEGAFEGLTVAQHEKFARSFERYFRDGIAPSKAVRNVFEKFKKWLTDIYQTIDEKRYPINDEVRHVFDRFFTAEDGPTTFIKADEDFRQAPDTAEGTKGATVAEGSEGGKAEKVAEESTEPPLETPEETESAEARYATPEKDSKPLIKPTEEKWRSDQELDKYVANINMERMIGDNDFRAALEGVAEKYNGFAEERRGLTKGEIIDLSDELGQDPAWLDRKKVGDAFNHVEIKVVRAMLRKTYIDTQLAEDAMRVAVDSGSEEAIRKAAIDQARAYASFEYVSGRVSQSAAEAGRALNAFNQIVRVADGAKDLSEFLKKNTNRSLDQLQKMAKLSKGLNQNQSARFTRGTATAGKGNRWMKTKDGVLYYYVNSLISGPVTHFHYLVGTELKNLFGILVESPIAATIDNVQAAFGKEFTEGDRHYFRQIPGEIYGFYKGHTDGWAAAVRAYKSGYSEALKGEKYYGRDVTGQANAPTISTKGGVGGAIYNAYGTPSRVVSGIHSLNKAVTATQETYSLAYRKALGEGLKGEQFTNRVAQLVANPTDEMHKLIADKALRVNYMRPTDYHSPIGLLTRFADSSLLVKMVVPFMKIGTQITREAFIEGTPLGAALSQEIRDNLMGRNGNVARTSQIARMSMGTGLIMTTMSKTLDGTMTGDGPMDPNDRRDWGLTHKPCSILIDGIWVPYARLGSIGMQLRFAANVAESLEYMGHDDMDKVAAALVNGFSESVLDESWMAGANQFLEMAFHYKEFGPAYIRNEAANLLPWSVGMGQVDRLMFNEHGREAHTLVDTVKRRIPGLSETLQPRIDPFGNPVGSSGQPQDYSHDPVAIKLNELNIGLSIPPRTIRGVKLDEKQYHEFATISGRTMKMKLDKLVTLRSFSNASEAMQIKMINSVKDDSRKRARSIMMHNYSEITRQAWEAKLELLKNPTHH